MQLSLSQTPKSISSANYLLRQYGGAAAAYSLQRLDTSTTNVVRARRSTDDAESNFTAEEVSGGSLREFALNNDADLIRFANQATAADKRMYFDGSDDYVVLPVTVTGITNSTWVFNDVYVSGTSGVLLTSGTLAGNFIASYDSGSASTAIHFGSGTPSIYIDDVLFTGTNRGQLYTALADGETHTVRVTGVNLTSWSESPRLGWYQTTTPFRFEGVIGQVEYDATSDGTNDSLWVGNGNTNADWEDQVGSNDGTVSGSPALFSGQGFDAYVTTLYDQSGNGRNATQATAASQPQIVADGVVVTDGNGNPAMSFDGTDDWLDHSYNVTLTSQSHFFLSQIESTAGADTRMYAMAVGTNADVLSPDLHIPASKTSILQRISVFDGGHIGASDITYGSPFLWTVLHSGSLISPFLDGSARPTGARTLNAAVTRQFIGAGCNTGTGPFLYTECKIAELIIYDNSNKSADRTAIEANIASRYGITIA